MDELTDGFLNALHEAKDPMKNFRKNTYEDAFRRFEAAYGGAFQKKEQEWTALSDASIEIAKTTGAIAACVRQELDALPKKRAKNNRLFDYNMTMVTFLFPAALDLMPQTGEKFTGQMIRAWKEQFPETDLKAASFSEINAGFQKRYCYITTAVCRSLGKSDDCYELTVLRDYRDGYLSRQPNGQELIRRYYDVAPTIVKHIDLQPDSETIYRMIWKNYLKPCIVCIEQGKEKECMELYTHMVYDLQAKFFLQISARGEKDHE